MNIMFVKYQYSLTMIPDARIKLNEQSFFFET